MRRSDRLVCLTQLFLQNPHTAVSLSDLAERLGAAKSSLSEDLSIVRAVFEQQGLGTFETATGAAGGIRYIPGVSEAFAVDFVRRLQGELADGERILPGGFLFMSDILGRPDVLDAAGRLFAHRFAGAGAEVVMTVETKGIPLAVSTARYLGLPIVVVRRNQRLTEGSAVSLNYVSGSDRRIQTMSLSRRSLREGTRALIVDDFMKAGGTARALVELLAEFGGEAVGIGVFTATLEPEKKLVGEYVSLVDIGRMDEENRRVETVRGTYFGR
ncbi:transcriptional regulator of the purine biosynthesis operon (PurR-pRpp) [Kyrpidia spormannii]|uniref:Transcriptional regulator of the purine biosynthesis operon (PurR-pRpp) n=2 Tax=Kyrpidia spormannii TaxID=2055160 RepID=A0A6F9DZQ8_9BACL|nr:transcriptional regulator of the purine biosynthesis operon (PurR-pRpp) [Kyrpidia spormannii]CAB3389748.1 transcriptional regulator of the purine biosynthesis operon (PurR-pRpp) [Kyrpidia spormannii]